LKPVENPWNKRISKNPATEDNKGYRRLHTKHTSDPTIITGTRPTVSASLPLKGREHIAVIVKREMINPLYSAPPKLVRYAGKSGISMLKLAKKRSELIQSSQNCVL
jgi:hypothetical protein